MRPDDWVRDDDPALLARLPAVGAVVTREHVVVTAEAHDETHYGHWSRASGTFRSGPATFSFSDHSNDGSGQSAVGSPYGWDCTSDSYPGRRELYSMYTRQSPDGAVVAFDCTLERCEHEFVNYTVPCRAHPPLVLRRVPYVPLPVRGSLRAALAGLAASLLLCVLTALWLRRPSRAVALSADAPLVPAAYRHAAARTDAASPDPDRASSARRRAAAAVFTGALLGSLLALRSVVP